VPRALSRYNALSFWAKASRETTYVDRVGFGNDNTPTSRYEAAWTDIPLTTEWQRFYVPIPLPAKVPAEDGLFYYADGDDPAAGADTLWFDDVQFVSTGSISVPSPEMSSDSLETFAGVTLQIRGTQTKFTVSGNEQIIEHMPSYFTFASSDPAVASVSRTGLITALASGSTTITATLGEVAVAGAVVFEVAAPDPTGAAPRPPYLPTDVIAIFSNAYDAVTVSEWSTTWDTAEAYDLRIADDDVKLYAFDDLLPPTEPYVAIDFQDDLINAEAAGMTHIHLDVWIPGAFYLRVKLVDFGSDGVYTDGSITPCGASAGEERDLSQHSEALLIADSDSTGTWAQVDIPLADFEGADFSGDCLWSRAHLAQLILTVPNGVETAYVDNIFFYKK
jgi:hypothetical protein